MSQSDDIENLKKRVRVLEQALTRGINLGIELSKAERTVNQMSASKVLGELQKVLEG